MHDAIRRNPAAKPFERRSNARVCTVEQVGKPAFALDAEIAGAAVRPELDSRDPVKAACGELLFEAIDQIGYVASAHDDDVMVKVLHNRAADRMPWFRSKRLAPVE